MALIRFMLVSGALLLACGCGPARTAPPEAPEAAQAPAAPAEPAAVPAPAPAAQPPAPGPEAPVPLPKARPETLAKVRGLLQRLESEVAEERADAWKEIQDMGDLATPALAELVTAGQPAERRGACRTIGLLGDKTGAAALRAALADGDASVRWHAARALGEVGDGGAKELLVEVLGGDKDASVRAHAAYALASLGSPEGLDFFKGQLKGGSAEDRVRAVLALGKYGGEAHLPEVISALADEEPSVRLEAVVQLDRSRLKPAVPGLIRALGDADYKVRKRAVSALERLTGQRSLGADQAKWKEWWDKNSATFDPRKRPQGGEREKAKDKAEKKEAAPQLKLPLGEGEKKEAGQ